MPKQYFQLHGRTMVEHSVAAFLALRWIKGVVVVVASGDPHFPRLKLAKQDRMRIVDGGRTRAESVLAGLRSLGGGSRDYVLVHDAARPCVTRAQIERLRDLASNEDGGLLAVPVADTLKRAEGERVRETVPRSGLWCAQTPQMFRADLLQRALEACIGQGMEVTDEAAAMELNGQRPLLVESRRSNIKVTYPEDLALAEFWLSRQESER